MEKEIEKQIIQEELVNRLYDSEEIIQLFNKNKETEPPNSISFSIQENTLFKNLYMFSFLYIVILIILFKEHYNVYILKYLTLAWFLFLPLWIVSFVIGYCIKYTYKLDFKKNKLIKNIEFLDDFINSQNLIDLNNVLLIGVSTEIYRDFYHYKYRTKGTVDFARIEVYRKINVLLVTNKYNVITLGKIQNLLIDEATTYQKTINTKLSRIAMQLKNCKYVPCDLSTKLVIKKPQYQEPIEASVEFISKYKQMPFMKDYQKK